VRVRPREPADHAAVQAFLARHGSAPGSRRGQLVYPGDYPALIAEDVDGHLLGMLTYVPERDWSSARP
jgi:hypothetical protein